MTAGDNIGQLRVVRTLLRIIAPICAAQKAKETFCQLDSWFTKQPSLKHVLELGFHDHRSGAKRYSVYGIPIATGKRGRLRKYGDKFTPEVVSALPVHRK